ncbi:LamG-like jellyroll fold domain-containing protein [Streptomyces sp. NBC_00063]|uniref:LamG-like jellyroll fold domain-containing protein n=1 Tax=Streptomyces sp. NBC_00063 TaxID=2975638 RepID=UPI003D7401C5
MLSIRRPSARPHRKGRGLIARVTGTTALALAVTVLGLPAHAAAPAAVADHLVLHYDFDDAAAGDTAVKDRSARHLDGVVNHPDKVTYAAGRTAGSKALDLPGGSATDTTAPYITVPGGLFKDVHAMTVSSWAKWDGGADFQWLYNLGKDNTKATFFTPSFADDHKLRSSVKPVNGTSEVGVSGSDKLPADQWVNITTVLDGTTITTYLNGVSIGSKPAALDLAATMYAPDNTTSGYLGKAFWSGHPFYAGQIDDFRVYDTALSRTEIRDLMGEPVPTVTSLSKTSWTLDTLAGQVPDLPATVDASFTDGIRRPLAITWDKPAPDAYDHAGTVTVTGRVEDADNAKVTATVKVAKAEIHIDLGESTGAFMGGASGTLYGIYGPQVPSSNLVDGINLRTVSTKAQDGPQHPGADALDVVRAVTDSSGGDTYIYMTDIYRGFPYQVPGDSGDAKIADFKSKIITQVKQALTLDEKYQKRIVFVPFNEPEGNMFGSKDNAQSFYGVNWLDDPTKFYAAWDDIYQTIKDLMPQARIGGPNASGLYTTPYKKFLQHTAATGTVPDAMTWHELSSPGTIRNNVATYRQLEKDAFTGTSYAGKQLPINLNEYANNYHTSVPGQMIQWVSAIEDSKVDGDLAYWNIDGNLSDSTVQSNRGNGQWWLLHTYSQMTGDTVKVTPPLPNASYTLQGVATLDKAKKQARLIMGGQDARATALFDHVDQSVFGDKVHALIREIPWSGQLGDSAQPRVIGETTTKVTDGKVALDFGGQLPSLKAESAYEIILTPGANASTNTPHTLQWSASYEAEKAEHTGTYSLQGPEGSPTNTYGTYTSGGYAVGGLRTGSDQQLHFTVDVPKTGTYDLSVFANSLNTLAAVKDQGPTNAYLSVDGKNEKELYLSLGYKTVVWGKTDTRVELTAGKHVITLAANSLDNTRHTKGDALIDKVTLALANPAATPTVYEAENGQLDGAATDFSHPNISGSGVVNIRKGQAATFWVYAPKDGENTVEIDTLGTGHGNLTVNGQILAKNISRPASLPVHLAGGLNKITVTGTAGTLILDRLRVGPTTGALTSTAYQAEDATTSGTASVQEFSLASGGQAVTGIGGAPGNSNTLTFDNIEVKKPGTYALTIRYANGEQSPATHYNPDPLARHADISVNGASAHRTWFPWTLHPNNFWELTIPVELKAGSNTIRFSSEELPNFDGTTYASDQWPDLLLRSKYAPEIDSVTVSPYTAKKSYR